MLHVIKQPTFIHAALLAIALSGCGDDFLDIEFTDHFTEGDEMNVLFFYPSPICLNVTCEASSPQIYDFEELVGFPLHLSAKPLDSSKPLPSALHYESADESILVVEASGCGELRCDGHDPCVSEDPTCETLSEHQINVALRPFKPGVVEIQLVDDAGIVYDRTTLTFSEDF